MRHELTRRLLACGALALLLAPTAQAAEPVSASNVWIRATMPGQQVGAAYLDLQSTTDATLIKAESPIAQSVELHQMSMENGVMKMRMLDQLALPAGKTVKLAPGGNHLMLFGLKRPLLKGEQVALTLHFRYTDGKVDKLELSAPVRAVAHQH